MKEIWNDDYEDSFEGKCDICNDKTLVRDAEDPYSAEINEESICMGIVCYECYLNRAEEI